jgi:CheY-like chemotaxis protein
MQRIVEHKKDEPQDSPVSLVVDYDGADDMIADYVEHLSTGKMVLDSPRQLEVGTKVHLKLAFPGLLRPIGVRGTVSSARHPEQPAQGMGIEFDETARHKLAEMIQRVRDRDPGLVVSRLVRILVVEDNPHVAQLIRSGLHGTGRRELSDLAFNFRTASNGRDALDILRSESFDVLIVDVYLPILDGAHVIAKIREDAKLCVLPIIAVSAGGDTAKDAALAAGADVFLDKPMRLRQIVDAMRGLIDLGATSTSNGA